MLKPDCLGSKLVSSTTSCVTWVYLLNFFLSPIVKWGSNAFCIIKL